MSLKVSRSAMFALVGLLAAGAVLGIWLGTRGGEQAVAPAVGPDAGAIADTGGAVAPDVIAPGAGAPDAAAPDPAVVLPDAAGAGLTGLDAVLAGGEITPEQDLTVPRIGIEDSLPKLGSPDVVWVDTRTAGEFAEGHIQGAVSLPAYEQEMGLLELPKDKEIIVYCA